MRHQYLIISGEVAVTLPLAYSTKEWTHTTNSGKLLPNPLRRSSFPLESIKGVIFYSDYTDKSVEQNNLEQIIACNIPCWPNPKILLSMMNRQEVMKKCIDNNLVDHKVIQSTYYKDFDFPFVLKTGTQHRGLDKFLISNHLEIPTWTGIATMEPFFKGVSVRVLIIGKDYVSYKIENSKSWIKNSPGAEVYPFEASNSLIEHAFKVAKVFELDIAGVDYIVNDDGFHFLEVNQYPALGITDESDKLSRAILAYQMHEIVKATTASV